MHSRRLRSGRIHLLGQVKDRLFTRRVSSRGGARTGCFDFIAMFSFARTRSGGGRGDGCSTGRGLGSFHALFHRWTEIFFFGVDTGRWLILRSGVVARSRLAWPVLLAAGRHLPAD